MKPADVPPFPEPPILSTNADGAPLSDLAYRHLAEAIIRGDIPPGAKLSEPDLSRRLGISRGPLREAVRQLEERGLVRRRPRAGVTAVRLSAAEILDLFIAREPLEGMAARLAAERATPADIARLRAILREEEEDPRGTNRRFHAEVARLSGSARILAILESDLYRLIRNWNHGTRIAAGRGARAAEEHRRITDAIADHDGELAELLTRRHIAAARAVMHASLLAGRPHDTREEEA
ncbi:GntR family transcriptional regulator [Roseococcus microcysteis]|uniref:GntR family transcriptional regulator n=1 Tax=Roseococcus microcysteis TaxID=2771361 RepID=UPI001CC3A0ED|nr:GntR family transcriptional regulator [Roseococcus microcysteis]